MKSSTIKILEAMDNGQTLSNVELNRVAGWRFWWHLHRLRQYWVEFKKTKGEWYLEYWTITAIPENIKYKDRKQLKVIRLNLLDRIYNFIMK